MSANTTVTAPSDQREEVHVLLDLSGLPDAVPLAAYRRRSDADATASVHPGVAVVSVPLDPSEPPEALVRYPLIGPALARRTALPSLDRDAEQPEDVVAQPAESDAAGRRTRSVSALAGHYARLQSTVVDALQPALERGADPLHALLAQAGIPAVEIVHTVQALRVALGDDERAVWRWLLESTPLSLGGATPHQALRQGRVAEVQNMIWQAVGGGFL